MLLDRPLLDDLAMAGVATGALGFLAGIVANLRVRRLRRGFTGLEGSGKDSVFDAVRRSSSDTAALRGEMASLRSDIDSTRRDLADALRHVSVIRYDAFGDMGGRLSFTVALLDDASDGLVITSIHGRSESRAYAKGIKSGNSEQTLSPEEQQAIDLAMRGSAKVSGKRS